MNKSQKRRVFAALPTPFGAALQIDHKALTHHSRNLLEEGCDGLVLFGTAGEAASLDTAERIAALEALVCSGVAADRLLVGTGGCALGEAVRLTRHAVGMGVAGVLVMPPFYYKPVTDEGLYAWYAALIEACRDTPLRLHLYHFPSISGVPIGAALTAKLYQDFPEQIVGYKDSGSDLAHTREILAAVPSIELRVGSEARFLDAVEAGGVGCISATISVFAAEAVELSRSIGTDTAKAKQELLARRRTALRQLPSITAVKHLLMRRYANPNWSLVRPPLKSLTAEEGRMLDALADRQFDGRYS